MRIVAWRHACVGLLAAVWLSALLLTSLPMPAFATGGAGGGGSTGGNDSTTGTGGNGAPGVLPSGGGGGGGAGTTGGNGGSGSISGSDVGGNGGAGGNHGVVTPLLNNGTALLGGAGGNGDAGITSGSGGGAGAGGYGAVVTTGAQTNSNSSTLSGGAGGAGGSAGVSPGNGGTGGIGVDFITSGAAFDNTGTTSGGQGGRGGNSPAGASGAAGAGGDAVVGTGTLTVTNSGTITGGSGNSGGTGFTDTGASSLGGRGVTGTAGITLVITNSGNGSITGGQGGNSGGGGANAGSGNAAISGSTVTVNNNDNATITGGAGGGGNSSNGGGGATAIAATTVTITNAAGASITGGAGGASPEFDGGAGGLAINGNGGTITNSGAIAAGAGGNANTSGGNAGTGGQGGTAIQGSGYTITNNSGATITGGAGGGVAASALGQGGSGGEGITGDNHTITNNGTITGGSGGSSGVDPSFDSGGAGGSAAAGILGSGNTITNTGTIRGGAGGNGGNASIGNGGAGADGADGIRGAGLTIVNSGTISGGSGGSGGAGAGGGTAGASGVFGNAITFTGGSNSLELQSGSLLSGQVVVQAGATASLILGGSGNASFDTSSLGPLGSGIFQGFTALQKTGTSTWTLSGTSGANLPWTISGGLINFAAAGNFGTGTITLSGGGLQWATGNTTDISGQLAAIGTGGATFDTNGNNVTLATALTGVASDGGLTKAGAGTLTLTAANTYTGATTVNGGVLSVNGSLTSATTVNAGATLQGIGSITGNVTVSGTIAPGNSIGTLTINGAYTQNAGSTYQVQVNNAGLSDKIVVIGAATLAGTLAVQAAAGKYQRTITYTILSATGGIGGSYSSLTSDTASLHPSVAISGNNLILTLLNSLAILPGSDTGSFTPNQQSVVNVLNQVSGSATGDLANALNALFNLSPSQVASILDTLGGQSYSGFSSLQIQSAQLFMDSFSLHTGGGVGTGSGASLPGGSTWQALKVDAADACGEACDVEPLWGAWGGGVGAFGTVAGDFNGHGLTYNLGGFVAGLDRKFAPGFRAGVAAGFNAATLYTNGIPGTGTSNTVQVALYGEYLHDAFYLDALGGYGHSDNRMNRPIVIPGLPFRMAQGYTNANTFFGQLEAGYKISVAPSFGEFLTPFARLQASTSTQAGFSETGADSLDLTIAQQTTNSLRTILGAQLGAGIDAPWHEKLDLVFRLGWSHEYADLSRPVTAAFAGAPALSFTTFGAQAPRDGVVLGLGANTQVAEHTSIYLRYDGDLAGANTNHVLNAGVRYVW